MLAGASGLYFEKNNFVLHYLTIHHYTIMIFLSNMPHLVAFSYLVSILSHIECGYVRSLDW
jgi:hypothetical protein